MFTPPAIYADPAFEMAVEQFRLIADYLNIDRNDRDRLLLPKRAVTVALPIHRDDGSTTVFTGYRVQHHLTMGPTKGGTRFAPSVNMGEVAALSIWMSWKCALAGLPYGGAKGGITVSPRDLSIRELEALSRRYMQEMIPFVGPHTDIMGPDMGTNEQVMAWFMDTYSVHMGHTVSEIVTGKPVFLGGSAGTAGIDRPRRGVPRRARAGHAQDRAGRLHGHRAGVRQRGQRGGRGLYFKSGVKIVGLSDAYAAFYDPKGIDLKAVGEHMRQHPDLSGFQGADPIDPEEMLVQPCDILIPAAVDRVINGSNAAAAEMPHPGRGRQRPDHPGGRRDPRPAAGRNPGHPRHPLQRRRGDRQLLRVGAGPPELLLERDGDRRQAVPHHGRGVLGRVQARAEPRKSPTAGRRWPSRSSGCSRPSRPAAACSRRAPTNAAQ